MSDAAVDEVLRVEGLRHAYGRLEALAGLTLELDRGECVALIGSNGSGKSTAVRTICGQLDPTEGTVTVGGMSPHEEPAAEHARELLAIVPDNPLLYEDLTVREHLELVAVAHGIDEEGLDERIDDLLERLAIASRRDFLPRELSRGMRQKTQLACALVRDFSLLILDEPVVGLDPPSQKLLHEILCELKADGRAILLTTHQMGFAEGLADRAVLLEEGEVIDQGAFASVVAKAGERGWSAT